MRIRRLDIDNFGSIESATFDDLKDVVVLVGRNGSGKSFVFEALRLFFAEMSLTGGPSGVQGNDYLWHRRDTDEHITVFVDLELSPDEAEELGVKAGTHVLVDRELRFQEGWRTSLLSCPGLVEVEDDTLVPNSSPGNPDTMDALVQMIRASFKLIAAARSPLATGLDRASTIDSATTADMSRVSSSNAVDDEGHWHRFSKSAESFLNKRFETGPAEPLVPRQGFRLPTRYLGGGEQEVLALIWQLVDDYPIVAIEEPESHLHPGLARTLFSEISSIAEESQFFLSTHSPGMVDKNERQNNWMLRLEGEKTKLERVEEADDLRALLAGLGSLPSDIFLKDLVVFVEGGTEKEAVLPTWASQLGLDLRDNPRVGVLSIGGEKKLKDNLRIWLKVVEGSPTDYLVVLDSHSADLVLRITREMNLSPENFEVLSKVCIEDFYPKELVLEGLKNVFDIQDPSPTPRQSYPSRTEQLLSSRSWRSTGRSARAGKSSWAFTFPAE